MDPRVDPRVDLLTGPQFSQRSSHGSLSEVPRCRLAPVFDQYIKNPGNDLSAEETCQTHFSCPPPPPPRAERLVMVCSGAATYTHHRGPDQSHDTSGLIYKY